MKWNRLRPRLSGSKSLQLGVLGLAGAILIALPAEAARLESWRFDTRANRLEFVTDTRVQPSAQLIFNPTRLVIDLPGTSLGRATASQLVNQDGVRSVRVGQFDAGTTRIVVEFDEGYTIDPQRIQVRGETDRQWYVQLPTAQRTSGDSPPPPTTGLENIVRNQAVSNPATQIEGIVTTADGFFVRTRGEVPTVEITTQKDGPTGRQMVLTFADSAIAPTFTAQSLPVNRYSISSWEAVQDTTNPPVARIIMNLGPDSPEWTAAASNIGGAVILPDGVSIREIPDAGPSQSVAAGQPIPVPEPTRPSRPGLPNRQPPANPEPPLPDGELPRVQEGRFRVVIDPGHGGRDPGAVGRGGLQEKQVVNPISLRVAELLRQQGVDVVMTRDRDYELGLDTRVQIAERADADFFVSIHANAINLSRPDVNGLETYYYSSRGQSFARDVHDIVLREMQMNDRRVRQARFYVIRRTSMPAILVEVGFVTGEFDAPNLADPAWRERMAVAIARGILVHLQRSS
ncbi:MAG: N-acetylmuramoyl-L-alanine amidase [Cyanobacteria bacterium J06632_22]